MSASLLPFVLVKQGSYLKKLINRGAFDPATAVAPEDVDIPDNAFVRKLRRQRCILVTEDHRLYANVPLLSKNAIWRRYIHKVK